MKKINLLKMFVLSIFMVGVVHAAECKCAATDAKEETKEEEKAEKDPQCPVHAKDGCGSYCGKSLRERDAAEFKGRKVLFCCPDCVKTFNKSPDDYEEQVKAQWALIDAEKEKEKEKEEEKK